MRRLTAFSFVALTGALPLFSCSDDSSSSNNNTGGTAGAAGAAGNGVATGGTAGSAGSATAGSTAGGTGGATAGAGGAAAGAGGDAGAGGMAVMCDTEPGMALQFAEGVNDSLTVLLDGGPSGDEPRTMELWAKFGGANSWTAEQTIIEMGRRRDAGNQVWGIDMSGYNAGMNGGYFGPYTNGISDNNGTSGPFLQAAADVGWLHLAWAYEGNQGELVFSIDGMKYTIQDPGANHVPLDLTPGILTLGSSQSFGTTGWQGIMDEVRIWNIYRSPEEIAADMNVILKGDEPGLVAYYDFNDSDGSEASDVNGNNTLLPCGAADNDRCATQSTANPMAVASDIPGPFTCAP